MNINDEIFKIELWDTAGQEKYNSLCKSFFKNVDGIVYVTDNIRQIPNLM